MTETIERLPMVRAGDRTRVFAVGHPGPQGLTNRPWPQQVADWRRIGEAVSAVAGWHPS